MRLTVRDLFTAPALFAWSVALGIGLRLIGKIDQPIRMVSDFAHHFEAAEMLLRGEMIPYLVYKGPAYAPWGAIGFMVLGGTDYQDWLLWNSLVLYPLTAWALFLLSREVIGRGRLSALPPLMLAVLPSSIYVARLTASENVALMGVCFAVYGFLRVLRRRHYAAAALGGFLLGLSILTKALLVMATPAMFLAFLVRGRETWPYFRLSVGSGGHNLRIAAAYAAVALVTVLPWSIYATSVVGKPVLSAAYADLALMAGNQPYGDALYSRGLEQAPVLIPDYDREAAKRLDYSQYSAYAVWYLRHHPESLLRDFRHNLDAQFGYTGLVARWVLREGVDGPIPYTTESLERAVFFVILGLGVLGLISRGGAVSSGAGGVIRLIALYGMVFVPFVVILGDERHRMAFMPFMMVLGAMYLRAAWRRELPSGPGLVLVDGFLAISGFFARGFPVLMALLVRRPWRSIGAILALALLAWIPVLTEKPSVRARDLIGGSVTRFSNGPVGNPHPVVGLDPEAATAGQEYEAVFGLRAPAGTYSAAVTYAAAAPIPVALYVNGELELDDVLSQPTGGAPNVFAVRRSIGAVRLSDGWNEIAFRQKGTYHLADLQRVALPPTAAFSSREEAGSTDWGISTRDHRLILSLRDLAYAEKIVARTGTIALQDTLTGGEQYYVELPLQPTGDVTVKLWILGYDAEGQRMRDQSYRGLLTATSPGFAFSPSVGIDHIQLLFEAWGDGEVVVANSVGIGTGPHVVRAGLVGPYIEAVEFQRIGD